MDAPPPRRRRDAAATTPPRAGADVVIRRPVYSEELKYTMLGAPWIWCQAPQHPNSDECRFGGNGGFAVRDPEFVKRYGVQSNPSTDGVQAWLDECDTMHSNDDIHLAKILNQLYVNGTLGDFKPAPRTSLMRFAAETIESFDPVALHKSWRFLSEDLTVHHFKRTLHAIKGALDRAQGRRGQSNFE